MTTAFYEWLDFSPAKGVNYYRVKANGKTGRSQYSKVVKVDLAGGAGNIVIYPAPFSGNTVIVQLNMVPEGVYHLQLTNSAGQKIWSKQFTHNGGSATETISLPPNLAGGLFQLELKSDSIRITKTLLKQ